MSWRARVGGAVIRSVGGATAVSPAMLVAAAMGVSAAASASPSGPIRVPDPMVDPPAAAGDGFPALSATPPGAAGSSAGGSESVLAPLPGQEYELAFFVAAGVLTILLIVGVLVLFLKFDRDPGLGDEEEPGGVGADGGEAPGEPRG